MVISSAGRDSTSPPARPRLATTSPARRRSPTMFSRKPAGMSCAAAMAWMGVGVPSPAASTSMARTA